MHDLVAKI